MFRTGGTMVLGFACTMAVALAQPGNRAGGVLQVSSTVSKGTVVSAPISAHDKTGVTGSVQLILKLQDPPLVVAVGANAKKTGSRMTPAQQQSYLAGLKQKQDQVIAAVRAYGGIELGRAAIAHNAVMISVDGAQIQNLHGIGGVVAVRPVANYTISAAQPDLPATLAYLGGSSVHARGNTGQNVRIAMLDTGIDYTHYNLGGSGNVADYQAAAAAAGGAPPAGLFPTAKVIGGYDFTGDTWPNGALQPDPNPIDLNGHGTLTADAAAGRSADGIHGGVAPGAKIYAVKVCSSVSAACSGTAMLEGLDFALDPTGSGTVSNAVDVISMSIGGPFGQREDDTSEALTDLVNFGVVAVVSAGNDGDIPYIVAHPAATPEVLSVAATTSVVSFGIPLVINSPAAIAGTYSNTATLDFAPVNHTLTGNIADVGRGCPAGSIAPGLPPDPYRVSPAGMIALIDRGDCAVSLKIDAAANAGAAGVLIALTAPGDAVSFSNDGGSNFPPSLVITQADATTIREALNHGPVNGTISPNNAISIASNVASYSSRGPNYSYNILKPDISAPGTIDAAAVGSGNVQVTESGTSFACPLTAGSAALLLAQNPNLNPADVKALLMENASPTVYSNSQTQPGVLAPLSRIGSGELRIDRATAGRTSAWDASNPMAVSLSFGTYRLSANQTFKKKVIVTNYSNDARTYTIANTYRDAPNATGVTLSYPSSLFVAPNSSNSFTVSLAVDTANLPAWTLDGGANGANGELLNTVEYAGYLTFSGGGDTVNLPWHILPHQSANVQPAVTALALNGNTTNLTLTNTGAPISGQVDTYSLTGTGTQFPASVLPAPGSDYAVINLHAVGLRLVCVSSTGGVCTAYGVQFAINTFGQRSHPDVPAEFDIHIDVDNDGIDDLIVFNGDIGRLTTGTFSGQNGVFVFNVPDTTATGPYFYTIADLDSANAVLTVPLSALATSKGSLTLSSPFTYSVYAFDNFYTGNLTDAITGMKYELDMPAVYMAQRFFVPSAGASEPVFPNDAATPYAGAPYNGNSPSQQGLLFLYTNGTAGLEASILKITR